MTLLNLENYSFSRPSLSNKINELELKLELICNGFRDLLSEVHQMDNESRSYQDLMQQQKERCESKTCPGSEELKGEIATKTNIIMTAASYSTKLNETKNLALITDILKVLCGDVQQTPTKKPLEDKENNFKNKTPRKTPSKKTKLTREVKKKLLSPKKELDCSAEDISFNEESISEIEGTPGRTSPIIGSKKLKSSSSMSSLSGNKTKCPNNWHKSDTKLVKLANSPKEVKGSGRHRQSRLTTFLAKPHSLVDLTNSQESSPASEEASGITSQNPQLKMLIKQESSENEDMILPSPTTSFSGNSNINISKSSKDSQKFKKPPLSLIKKEVIDNEVNSPIISVVGKKLSDNSKTDLEESINILQPKRLKSPSKDQKKQLSPTNNNIDVKPFTNPVKIEIQDDVAHCEHASMSVLQKEIKIDEGIPMDVDVPSPTKRPLVENKNVCNVTPALEDSMSLLKPETSATKSLEEKCKRKLPQNDEAVYKEPTVRKKAEKMALPGWVCEECVNFFGDFYDDDPEKIAKIVARCSKHRGRRNPARPKTPTGFWNPRWNVPEDTEEFNRRNNAN